MMFIKYAVLVLLLFLTVNSDMRYFRIKNLHIICGLSAGFVLNLLSDGLQGLVSSFLAAMIPIFILLLLFVMRMMGAGDIKLYSAIGSIMGPEFIIYTLGFSFLFGGVLAITIMLFRGSIRARLHHLALYLKILFLTRNFTPYTGFYDKSDGSKFHFAPAIAAGCCLQFILIILSKAPGIV